jgi:capsular exopolysaccharide synthesis family protein
MQNNLEPMFKTNNRDKEDETINIDKVYSWIQEYWMSIVISIVASMLIAVVYLRYATPKYVIHAKVLIKGEQKDASNGALLAELGMGGGKGNVENEVEIFKSRILMQHVIENLHLNIQNTVSGKITATTLYKDAPIKITPLFNDSSIYTSSSYKFKVAKDGGFDVDINGKNVHGKYGDIIELTEGKVLVEYNPLAGHLYDDIHDFTISICPSEALVDGYVSRLTIELLNKQSSIVDLSFIDVIQQRGEDVLNRLIEEYKLAIIEDKNQVAEGTLSFIEDRLHGVDTSLTIVEKDIAGFKKANKIIDVESQSKLLLENTGDNAKELTQKEVQLKILEALEKYLKDNNNVRRVMPATLITQDVTLDKIIEEYNTLQANRLRMLRSYTENSPHIAAINSQMDDARERMTNYITSLKRGYEVSVEELTHQKGDINNKLAGVPETQRVSLEYQRKQQIMQELYLFLLKKREETAISKAATVSNIKIIDPAKRSSAPISPVRSKIYLIALVVGIIIPSVRIAAKELFNNRIGARSDIERISEVPIFAEIGHNTDGQFIVVRKDSKTVLAEQFRALRTNLQFLLTNETQKTIMITSSMSGEGKSFISANIAASIALSGKKVVLMELDLRKPKLSENLHLQNKVGFSNYIIGQAELDTIISPSGVFDNLFVVSSGPIPPNPAELFLLPKMQQLFDELYKRFDIIMIDTAPVGLVTDAQLLSKYADTVMYVLRQNYTYRQQLKSANNLYKAGKLPHMGFIINDSKMNRGSEFAYGYGNSSGYFEQGEQSLFTSIIKKFKRNS